MFCAICTRDIDGDIVIVPLGKGGAPVSICTACDDEHPREGRYSFDDAAALSRALAFGQRKTRKGTI